MIARRAICVAVVVAGVGVGAVVHGWALSRGDPAAPSVPDPLTTARAAVTKSTFEGTVRVEWLDGGRPRTEDVHVDDDNGLLVVGDSRAVMSDGEEGLVRESDGWIALAGDAATASTPVATSNYRFSTLGNTTVLGRPARVVEAVGLRGGLRERFYLDVDTDVLLKREQIDRGRTVRSVGFVSITRLEHAEAAQPAAPQPRERMSPLVTTELTGREAPRVLGNGYELADAYRRPDGSLQLYYSDGLHGMSVFEQRGRLRHDAFPVGGRDTTINGHAVRVYAGPAGRTIVWDTGRAVYACVTDAPLSAAGALLAKFPAHRSRSGLVGLMHFVLAPFSWE